jgi:hypothetical protein
MFFFYAAMRYGLKTDQLLIMGKTIEGKRFRPSDWAERLCGVLDCFDNPRLKNKRDSQHISFSVYAYPVILDQVNCIALSQALKTIEPEAYDFFLKFAKDNQLQVIDVCWLETPTPIKE